MSVNLSDIGNINSGGGVFGKNSNSLNYNKAANLITTEFLDDHITCENDRWLTKPLECFWSYVYVPKIIFLDPNQRPPQNPAKLAKLNAEILMLIERVMGYLKDFKENKPEDFDNYCLRYQIIETDEESLVRAQKILQNQLYIMGKFIPKSLPYTLSNENINADTISRKIDKEIENLNFKEDESDVAKICDVEQNVHSIDPRHHSIPDGQGGYIQFYNFETANDKKHHIKSLQKTKALLTALYSQDKVASQLFEIFSNDYEEYYEDFLKYFEDIGCSEWKKNEGALGVWIRSWIEVYNNEDLDQVFQELGVFNPDERDLIISEIKKIFNSLENDVSPDMDASVDFDDLETHRKFCQKTCFYLAHRNDSIAIDQLYKDAIIKLNEALKISTVIEMTFLVNDVASSILKGVKSKETKERYLSTIDLIYKKNDYHWLRSKFEDVVCQREVEKLESSALIDSNINQVIKDNPLSKRGSKGDNLMTWLTVNSDNEFVYKVRPSETSCFDINCLSSIPGTEGVFDIDFSQLKKIDDKGFLTFFGDQKNVLRNLSLSADLCQQKETLIRILHQLSVHQKNNLAVLSLENARLDKCIFDNIAQFNSLKILKLINCKISDENSANEFPWNKYLELVLEGTKLPQSIQSKVFINV